MLQVLELRPLVVIGISVTLTITSIADDDSEPAFSAVEIMDCNVDVENERTPVVAALEYELISGMSSGKHSDPRGIG